ncbi:ribonuclease P/MRP protein subunit POP5-like [Anneissia japonica]|uniref:ribonuclease P/MRP protein subunit POP5-like n=1 Tax=Anneissia japonica TaxID=1529436 RepID=UPI0014256A88|nr:ribonuclease P/MRP protein subunit POP5-like [Anneissia japonica]
MVRLRNRYLLCEIIFDERYANYPAVVSNDILSEIKNAVVHTHGDYGMGAVQLGLNVKYLNPHTQIFIVRSRRSSYKIVWTSLPFVNKLCKKICKINTLHCGGTIRTCQKFLLKYQRQQLSGVLLKCQSDEERKAVKESILSCTLKEDTEDFMGEDEEDIDSS